MKVIDILNTSVTVLCSVSGYRYNEPRTQPYIQTDMTLDKALHMGIEYKEQIMQMRGIEDKDVQKAAKGKFPTILCGGTFPHKSVKDTDILTYSNVVMIDIDQHDNDDKNLMEYRQLIYELPYVVGVLKSIRGNGLFAIVKVADGKYTKEYYKYIANLWNHKFGLNIDLQCTNIARKRFITYDEDIDQWIKPNDTDIMDWSVKYIEPKKEVKATQQTLNIDDGMIERTHKAMEKVINGGYVINGYGAWYHVGCEIKAFDDYNLFYTLSTNNRLYSDSDDVIRKKWDRCVAVSIDDDLHRKWQGMAKRHFGDKWWRSI